MATEDFCTDAGGTPHLWHALPPAGFGSVCRRCGIDEFAEEIGWRHTGLIRCTDCYTTVRTRTLVSLPPHRCTERQAERLERFQTLCMANGIAKIAAHKLMRPAEADHLDVAVRCGDYEAIRSMGHDWSGQIALDLLELADVVDPDKENWLS